ncbi:hypothetical protein GA0115256_14685 [Streptomyces sp. DconLS]|nr:hypothetical protein GA0115258_10201 [Streptomyces sp. LamerLS-31b]SCG02853.1 hypothetical protein GA0115256_14685 [Streptomyces sp. DconLS]
MWSTFGPRLATARALPDVSLTTPSCVLGQRNASMAAVPRPLSQQRMATGHRSGAETLMGPTSLAQVLQRFGRLNRWSSVPVANASYHDAAKFTAWFNEGLVVVWAPTGSGKTEAALHWPLSRLKRSDRFRPYETKAAPAWRGGDAYDVVIRDEAHRSHAEPAAGDQKVLSGAQLTRAISLFTSLAGLQVWLHQRHTAQLQDVRVSGPPGSETADPVSRACGVRRLAEPLVPRAPGRELPGVVELGDFVLGALPEAGSA